MARRIIDRGATDIQVFTLPGDITGGTVDYIMLYYKQNGQIALKKKIKAEDIGSGSMTVRLSPRETIMFMGRSNVAVQMQAFFKDGTVRKSNLMTRYVDDFIGG